MAECDRSNDRCRQMLCVHRVPVFSSLNHEDLIKVSALIRHREFQKGETIFLEGGKPDSLILINDGSAKAFKVTPDGREQILYVFSQGDFFGEQYLFGNLTASYTVTALETVQACMLSKEHFRQMLRSHPDIAIEIIEELGERMAQLENAMQTMGTRNVDARIGTLLLDYAVKFGSEAPEGTLIRLPLSREGMANYLGVARETVSRKLAVLENEGVIRSLNNKTILLLDRAALQTAAGAA